MIKKLFNKSDSLLTAALNTKASNSIRWCTPSIDLEIEKVLRPYESDMSVSYQSLGMPSIPSGIFKTAYKKAAKVYGADSTLFSANGSTGSNFVVLRALSKQIPFLKVLAMRNIHKSILYASEDYSINLMLLPPNIDEKLQIFLPNTIEEILDGIEKSMPDVLLITNPTYEGITLDLKTLVKKVRSKFPNIIIFVEEAWGAHLHFSNKLPISAMEAGADICIQSTHKHGGALQQTGMIHWKKGRINEETLLDSYQSITTSSPSFFLLASLDAVRAQMEKGGKRKVEDLIIKADKLSGALLSVPGIKVVSTESLQDRNPSVYDRDKTKVIVDVTQSGMTGFGIAEILEKKYNIIVERYDAKVLLFLVPFQTTHKDIESTVKALKSIVSNGRKQINKLAPLIMKIPRTIIKLREISEIAKLRLDQIEKIPVENAHGRISAEDITIYPPGIPITIKGEKLTREMIEYFLLCKEFHNCKILCHDEQFKTIVVVK